MKLNFKLPETENEYVEQIRELVRIHDLMLIPCTKFEKKGNGCANHKIPFSDFCDRCKDYWTAAATFAGVTPEYAVEETRKETGIGI